MKKKFITRTMWMLFFVICFFAFAGDAKSEECLSYEPAKVRITGTIVRETFPGPPNYRSIKEGDEIETVWILKLSKPVCVDGDPKDEINVDTEKNVGNMHLVIFDDGYVRYKHLLNRKVIIEGTLSHAVTGHHRTKVLLRVTSIKQASDGNKK